MRKFILKKLNSEENIEFSKFWGAQSNFLHLDEKQIDRQNKALSQKHTPLLLDRDNKKAQFKGSEGEIYISSLDNCTCMDYTRRKKPCKHMYRLAYELGFFVLENNQDQDNCKPDEERESVKESLNQCDDQFLEYLYKVCLGSMEDLLLGESLKYKYQNYYISKEQLICNKNVVDLISMSFLIICDDKKVILDKLFKKNELLSSDVMNYLSNISVKLSAKANKQEIVDILFTHMPDLIDKLCHDYVILDFSSIFYNHKRTILNYIRKKLKIDQNEKKEILIEIKLT